MTSVILDGRTCSQRSRIVTGFCTVNMRCVDILRIAFTVSFAALSLVRNLWLLKPKGKLVSVQRAFFVTGCDLFGPIFVTELRKKIKRWGCLFVCFSMRAVHLEMCYDMSCNSFLNAFFRFFQFPQPCHTSHLV